MFNEHCSLVVWLFFCLYTFNFGWYKFCWLVGWFLNLILNIRSPYFHFHLSLSHGQTLLLTLRSGDLLGSGGTKGKVLDYRSNAEGDCWARCIKSLEFLTVYLVWCLLPDFTCIYFKAPASVESTQKQQIPLWMHSFVDLWINRRDISPFIQEQENITRGLQLLSLVYSRALAEIYKCYPF